MTKAFVKDRTPDFKNPAKRYGYRVLGKNIFISNNSRESGLNNNDLVCGGTGTSKTGSIVYTQLKSLKDSSLIVADSKGQLRKMFTKELENKGYKVLTLDFVNPETSCVYNPLAFIRKNADGSYREQDITKIARVLLPDSLGREDPYWVMSARALLEFLMGYTLYNFPEEDHSMYTVSGLLGDFMQEMGELAFLPYVEENPGSFVARRFKQIQGVKKAEKTITCIYSFANTALYPFDITELRNIFDPEYVKRSGKRTELDIASLGRRKTVIFLNLSDSDHSLDALVNLFYTQTLQTLIAMADSEENGQLKVPVRIIMDDFASTAVIPDFDKIISVVRSRDIWLTMCIQSFTQLESLYSHTQAQTIIDNCDHIVYLGGNNLESARFIGTRAKKVPEVILGMDRSKEYIIEGGKLAVLVDKIPSYSYVDIDDASHDAQF